MPAPIERIVVPLDAASDDRTAIETAARLAARAKAPLHGVFVEDEDLLHAAGLPFARQFTLGGAAEKLTPEHVELHLRLTAERARAALLAAAKRHGVAATFEIVRGAAASAFSRVSERDLVVAGALTRPVGGHFRVEARWWSSIATAPGPFLLARHGWGGGGGVAILLRDRSRASARLLETAAQLAQSADSLLTVICPPAVAGREGFDKWIADRLAGHPVRVEVEVEPAEPAALHRRLGELDCRCLAVSSDPDAGDAGRLRELAERYGCDILIVG